MKRLLLLAAAFWGYCTAQAQTWTTVGNAGLSAGSTLYNNIAIDGNGIPYVVYRDSVNGYRATVMKFDGINWVTVGNAGFSVSEADFTVIALDGNGVPYVAYMDQPPGDHGTTVMKYDGSKWVTVGARMFSATALGYVSLAIDNKGTPYIGFTDEPPGSPFAAATVMKFDGTNWVTVGLPGFTPRDARNISLALDAEKTPYIAFVDYGIPCYCTPATVMKFNGDSWATVGAHGFSGGSVEYTSLTFDKSGTPYVAYSDVQNNKKATVMKFNGISWELAGNQAFSEGIAANTNIAVDRNGIPYVVYSDFRQDSAGWHSGRATVMKLNGSTWENVGTALFSPSAADFTTIAMDEQGIPYVSYMDGANANKATVKRFGTPNEVKNMPGQEETLAVYPNPANDELAISYAYKIHSVIITNVIGRTVYTGNYNAEQIWINIKRLPAGIYQVRVNGAKVKKFVKQ